VVSASRHPEGDVTVAGPDGGLQVPKWMLAAPAARFCVSAHRHALVYRPLGARRPAEPR
jgi:hypothetical protein